MEVSEGLGELYCTGRRDHIYRDKLGKGSSSQHENHVDSARKSGMVLMRTYFSQRIIVFGTRNEEQRDSHHHGFNIHMPDTLNVPIHSGKSSLKSGLHDDYL